MKDVIFLVPLSLSLSLSNVRTDVDPDYPDRCLPATALEDCLASKTIEIGPSGTQSPIIIEHAWNQANAGAPGCYGCNIRFQFTIFWTHEGLGVTVDPFGFESVESVKPGQTRRFDSGWKDIACNLALRYDFVSETGGSFIEMACAACQ
jgi:hypothetical protein